jgi:hypothetical protein
MVAFECGHPSGAAAPPGSLASPVFFRESVEWLKNGSGFALAGDVALPYGGIKPFANRPRLTDSCHFHVALAA